jgi:hypothetical protein
MAAMKDSLVYDSVVDALLNPIGEPESRRRGESQPSQLDGPFTALSAFTTVTAAVWPMQLEDTGLMVNTEWKIHRQIPWSISSHKHPAVSGRRGEGAVPC